MTGSFRACWEFTPSEVWNALEAFGPDNQVKHALQRLYGFCSDYPGIRHAGTAANARRALDPKDSTLIYLLLLSFSGYLSPQVDPQALLGAT